ncbi:MAG TPA: N-6 DNA methylase [Ktedonobacteraceae bacterium]|nr:N-6 DNA methylase [Ktedonobacteraceae bacterium]
MTTPQERFNDTVIEPLKINMGGNVLSYAEYLKLPGHQRSNDEADVVDNRFTQRLLEWLGFEAGDIIYNRPLPGHPQDKPDFVVKITGSTAFIIEDKSTDENFTEAWVKQLRRYTAGTSGYCLWTNARTILGLRFDANGQYQTLVEVRVDGVFGAQKLLSGQEANFEILHLLFHKQRFTDISHLINAIAINASDWEKQAKSLTDEQSLETFIRESRFVLEQLATVIKARLSSVTIELEEAADDLASSQQKYMSITSDLIDRLKGGGGVHLSEITALETELHALEARLIDIDISFIEQLKPAMTSATVPLWTNTIQEINALISTLRERELSRVESRRIRAAYLVWLERYKVIEGEERGSLNEIEARRQQAFAEQVSYVFFVRLLLARVLEDKGIMPRLVSDGGFKNWFDFLKSSSLDSIDEIRGESFLPLVYRRVANFYRHFFQQPVFDWFQPDDYLLALVLYRLNMYNFKDVTNDLLGFTYEAFIDRVARNQKGHFLTPPDVVEYMLDRAVYNTPSIIGESFLDMACGSGSFLVHAARRLKQVLNTAMASREPLERARLFIEQVKSKLVGLEINPFSCYLAELNLFIQVLDDLILLWNAGERPNIERFSIYNTNSLEMPQAVLSSGHSITTAFTDEAAALDEAAPIKSRYANFSYVVCNPPYVNRGIILGAKSYGEFPFYREIVKGDENFYLLFLRLATYYVAPGGTICFICPLNLFGDESTMRAREIFNRAEWCTRSITRFYARDILFPGVLQGICIVRFDKIAGQPSDIVEIRGGHSVEEAAQTATQVEHSRVAHNYPVKTTWNKPWLVNADPAAYDLWEFVRDQTKQDLSDLLQGKLEAAKGDVRSTWAKPMLASNTTMKGLPLTKGKNVVDWGGWSAVAYLDPSIHLASSIKDYTGSRWVQRQAQRIADLSETETVILLKEVSGLEMKRPIRGTILQRDKYHPVVADETLLVIYTLGTAYEDLAYAIFGLLTSSIYNLLFSLFSTNAHANFKEILRLPVPLWSSAREKQLADETRAVLYRYKELYDHEKQYGIDRTQQVSINDVLISAKLPTLRLEELILRGDITMNGASNYSLEVLLNRNQLILNQILTKEAALIIERILRANGTLTYLKGGKDILLPNPRVATTFSARLQSVEQEREDKLQKVSAAQHALDNSVLDAYSITTPSWRELVETGLPWAKN